MTYNVFGGMLSLSQAINQWYLLSILVQTTWFCGEQLQNDGALKFVQFF